MRAVGGLVLAVVVMLSASARAQTYDPSYPVCLQVYGFDGTYISCGYTSMDQCRLSASGRAALCFVNPYFSTASVRARTYRRTY